MAHHKSSKKRIRQTIKKTADNKMHSTFSRSLIKKVREQIEAKDKDAATTSLVKVQSALAKLAKKGVIKPNKASRTTSRLAHQVNAI